MSSPPNLPGSGGLLSGGHLSRWGWKTRRGFSWERKKEKTEGNDPFVLLAPPRPIYIATSSCSCLVGGCWFLQPWHSSRNIWECIPNWISRNIPHKAFPFILFLFFLLGLHYRDGLDVSCAARLASHARHREIMKAPPGLLHELTRGRRKRTAGTLHNYKSRETI